MLTDPDFILTFFSANLSRISELSVSIDRADFTLQLLMFVTAEKEGQMFIILFLSSFCQLLSPQFQARIG